MIAPLYKAKQIFLIFSIGILLASCNHRQKIDVSNIPVEVQIERFDHDFDAMRTHPMVPQAAYLQRKYGPFYTDFIKLILQTSDITDTAYFKMLREVFTRKVHNMNAYTDLKHEVDSVYPGAMDKQNAELTDAFKRIEYYYPAFHLPKVYAYFSGFQAQTTLGNGYVGIGLDLFLGANSKFYPAIIETFPHYISQRFTPGNITPRVVESIVRENMYPENDNDKSLLTRMVYNGKILYMMDQLLPDVPDTTKIGYTTRQLKWCQDNQAGIWGYFLENNLLYEADYQKIQQYVTEAPFTPGIGEKNESAPKLGVWTGWQIVKLYMEKHPDVTLQQLMAEADAQKILNGSKYRPK